jgi:ribonucleoside-diphosphate reductase alpha chain
MTPAQDTATTPTTAPAANGRPREAAAAPAGLVFERTFARPDLSPYDELEWARSDAVIADHEGKEAFRQDGVEAPASWSPQSVNVVASKFFWGDQARGADPRAGGREHSVRQLVGRVAGQLTAWGRGDGRFASHESAAAFRSDLEWLLLNQHASFNSPVWFNAGLAHAYGLKGSAGGHRWDPDAAAVVRCDDCYRYPQVSACFLQSVTDDMEGIMALASSEAQLFKHGSGTGTDLSPLRSTREKLTGGGKPSGPVSFLRIYDTIGSVIKSGGRTRRSAKLNCLRVDHPDIREFVRCKRVEEGKARALAAAGYSSGIDGEAARTVAFQNVNLSVSATDQFLEAARWGAPFQTRAVTTGAVVEELDASALLDDIARGTWECGCPGMLYIDTMNRWHTVPDHGPIRTCNPCGEYVHIDDSACNLASLNLMRFRRPDGSFDPDRFRAAVRVLITAQEIVVDHASYPTERIALNSHRFRPLGLGTCGLGALLMASGLPYDSDEGRSLAGAIMAIMTGEAYAQSARLAAAFGPFEGFAANRQPMLNVIRMHAVAAQAAAEVAPDRLIGLWDVARACWLEAQGLGARHGYRNAQTTLNAPTGTIAFKMGSGHSTGIEPILGLVQYKSLAGGGSLRIVAPEVPEALRRLGYQPAEVERIAAHVDRHGTAADVVKDGATSRSGLEEAHLPVFDNAFPAPGSDRSIPWPGHVRMLAAIQPFISGSSSKTINMPSDSTVADVRAAYLLAWELGCKDIAIYRDGSKESQPVSTRPPEERADPAADRTAALEAENADLRRQVDGFAVQPRRVRLPDTRDSRTHKFEVAGHEGYLTAGLFPDGRPGELFIKMAKEGSTIGGLMDTIATEASLCLQYGVPLEALVHKFAHARFEPSGPTPNPDIPFASSVVDYAFRWMEFLPGYREAHAPPRVPAGGAAGPVAPVVDQPGADRYVEVSMRGHPGWAPDRQPGADRYVEVSMRGHPGWGPDRAAAGPPCPDCGAITQPAGRCFACPQCGWNGGCG